MDDILSKLHDRFPSFPVNILIKIYESRLERLKVLTRLGMPREILWLIEAKVRSTGELQDSFISVLPGLGKSSYAKKRRAKRLKVCRKCARWNCDESCRSLGWASNNREDKLYFIRNGLSKESLDNILLTLETHSYRIVQGELLKLWNQFQDELQRLSLGNLTENDPVCQFIRKLDGKLILDS